MPLNFNEAARLLNAQLAGVAYTAPSAHSLSLHSAAPGSTDTPASEALGGPGPYARQSVAFGAVTATGDTSTQVGSNSGVVTFTGLPANTWTNIVVWNNTPGSGTPQANGALASSVTTASGQSLTFAAGSITAQLA